MQKRFQPVAFPLCAVVQGVVPVIAFVVDTISLEKAVVKWEPFRAWLPIPCHVSYASLAGRQLLRLCKNRSSPFGISWIFAPLRCLRPSSAD
ncbi:hypothetical protein KL86CLO1_12917 [uncultured Eubacteriales bacterium]|uniref:Uncharacterized protein n=1 Tax=uncultured Eubacteriales bacterium TaxID=172733 RepID=A0A212KFH6_9FIRM|nr:hypothetical protein KL86CLO1_12917 [uncultured Eubacteriales bacterium]